MNSTDLQDWELLPREEFILNSDKSSEQQHELDERGLVEVKPSIATESRQKSFGADSIKAEECDDGGNLNIWKWSLNGIGTVCSFGVAAASICIIILGNHRKNNKLQFHIYTKDKRIKNQHSRKLDEEIFALGGAIIMRARVTFGVYCDITV